MSYFLRLFDLYSICIRRCCSTLTISASKEEETLTHKNIRASHYTLLTKTLLAVLTHSGNLKTLSTAVSSEALNWFPKNPGATRAERGEGALTRVRVKNE